MSDYKYSQTLDQRILNYKNNQGNKIAPERSKVFTGAGNPVSSLPRGGTPMSALPLSTSGATRSDELRSLGSGTRVNIPVDKLAIKGNAVSNAQQIERNRGAIQINQHQQSLLKVKDRNFVDTEYGNATEVYGNYVPDDDEYESASVDSSYNYKQSAEDLMKERAKYS